ncbi:MAG: hypothetical protein LBQ60_05115 [Bacteroidales bacterium]|nr:hypothetical protein [Bacteroidales bacterium]
MKITVNISDIPDSTTITECSQKAADLKATNIAANNRKVQQSQSNLDDAWGNFENAFVGEINDTDGTGEIMLVDWFATHEQAQQTLNKFTETAKVGEVNIRKLVYKGKPKTTNTNASGGDFRGTGGSSEPAKKKDSFWD